MSKVPIYLIAAVGRQGELGKNNELIWRIPDDLKRFKALTTGNTVIMGRKTFLSIGKALPRRFNIVLSRDGQFNPPGVWVRSSLESAMRLAKCFGKPVFVIGGQKVYELFMPVADRLYLTEVDAQDNEADVYFPEFLNDNWRQEEVSSFKEFDGLRYRYVTYFRKSL